MSLPTLSNTTSQIDQEFTQINQQFQDLSLQYQNNSYEYGNINSTQKQAAETGIYNDSTSQFVQQNLYEPQHHQQQQTDFYGQPQQMDSIGNNSTGYTESASQMYQQQQTYNDSMSYDASNYGAAEVSATSIVYIN